MIAGIPLKRRFSTVTPLMRMIGVVTGRYCPIPADGAGRTGEEDG
jgi:CRISPR/Cas system-associated protein Cas7 (RAMP superfamily)